MREEWTEGRREGVDCARRPGCAGERQTEKQPDRGREENCADGDILAFWLPEFKRLSPTTFISYS